MGASDEIKTEDWDKVHELALLIANASLREEGNEKESAVVVSHGLALLLPYLDELTLKYGALPSILATRADYIDNMEKRIVTCPQ